MSPEARDGGYSQPYMTEDLTFSSWLKQRRKALDMTQGELARLSGCSVETLRKIEAGALRPSRQLAALLAEHMEIPDAERETFVQLARTVSRPVAPLPEPASVANGLPAQPPTNLHGQPTPFIGRGKE